MKILIVAATSMEVKMLVDEMIFVDEKDYHLKQYKFGEIEVHILITGIGSTFTTFYLTNALKDFQYQMVLNIGIAASMSNELNIGDVVNVVSEEIADLGIEKEDEFLTLFESGYMSFDEFPFEHGTLKASESNGLFLLKKVKGITLNKSLGSRISISEINKKFSAQVESREGAAVLYVCKMLGVPCYQVRSISNDVNVTNETQWDIPVALENLKIAIVEFFKRLSVSVN